MFKELVKLSISGSAISGVLLVDLQPKVVAKAENKTILEKIKSDEKSFASIKDVALYEKATGCSFVFSNSEGLEKLQAAEEFWKQIKEEGNNTTLSENSIFEWANTGKKHCNNKVVTIFRKGKNVLRLGDPNGGWRAQT